MKINILIIFSDMFKGWMEEGMISRAINDKIVEINIIDFREYSSNKHHKVDDSPFGGKEGMLLTPQPIFDAILKNGLDNTHTIFPSPRGKVLKQTRLEELSNIKEITLIAGRYEGVDQRVIDTFVDEEISLGDFILTGGELAIEVILDGIIRLLPGVLNNASSHKNESFSNNLLEHDQYTRPAIYEEMIVPEVLRNGNHKLIDEWILKNKIKNTYLKRPDLLDENHLSPEELKILESVKEKYGK